MVIVSKFYTYLALFLNIYNNSELQDQLRYDFMMIYFKAYPKKVVIVNVFFSLFLNFMVR